jgi:hypothetical protein
MTKKTVQKPRAKGKAETEAEAFKRKAVEYAQKAYTAALDHFAATDGRPSEVLIRYQPCDAAASQFAQYEQDGRFFAEILANPACPETFRKLFSAVFCDEFASGVRFDHPRVLPILYPVFRDFLDANSGGGNAEGAHDTLIRAVEILVPDEVSDRAREVMNG